MQESHIAPHYPSLPSSFFFLFFFLHVRSSCSSHQRLFSDCVSLFFFFPFFFVFFPFFRLRWVPYVAAALFFVAAGSFFLFFPFFQNRFFFAHFWPLSKPRIRSSTLGALLLHLALRNPDLAGVHLRCEPQRAERLVEVLRQRVHVDEHEHLRLVRHRRLQHVRQLRLPERNGGCALAQRRNYVAKAGQRLVDVLRLLQPVALGTALGQTLAARQVDEVELPAHLLLRGLVPPLHLHDEDGVRTGGHFVDLRARRLAVVRGLLEKTEHSPLIDNLLLLDVRDDRLRLRVPDLVLELRGVVAGPGRVRVCRVQHVVNGVVVDLDEGAEQTVLEPALLRLPLAIVEDLAHGPRNHPACLRVHPRLRALHGERLARTRLTVGEDAHLVAVKRRLHKLRDLLEHTALRRVLVEHLVEVEVHLLRVRLLPEHTRVRGHVDHRQPPVVRALREGEVLLRRRGACLLRPQLLLQRGAHAGEHADVPLQLDERVVQLGPHLLADHQELLVLLVARIPLALQARDPVVALPLDAHDLRVPLLDGRVRLAQLRLHARQHALVLVHPRVRLRRQRLKPLLAPVSLRRHLLLQRSCLLLHSFLRRLQRLQLLRRLLLRRFTLLLERRNLGAGRLLRRRKLLLDGLLGCLQGGGVGRCLLRLGDRRPQRLVGFGGFPSRRCKGFLARLPCRHFTLERLSGGLRCVAGLLHQQRRTLLRLRVLLRKTYEPALRRRTLLRGPLLHGRLRLLHGGELLCSHRRRLLRPRLHRRHLLLQRSRLLLHCLLRRLKARGVGRSLRLGGRKLFRRCLLLGFDGGKLLRQLARLRRALPLLLLELLLQRRQPPLGTLTLRTRLLALLRERLLRRCVLLLQLRQLLVHRLLRLARRRQLAAQQRCFLRGSLVRVGHVFVQRFLFLKHCSEVTRCLLESGCLRGLQLRVLLARLLLLSLHHLRCLLRLRLRRRHLLLQCSRLLLHSLLRRLRRGQLVRSFLRGGGTGPRSLLQLLLLRLLTLLLERRSPRTHSRQLVGGLLRGGGTGSLQTGHLLLGALVFHLQRAQRRLCLRACLLRSRNFGSRLLAGSSARLLHSTHLQLCCLLRRLHRRKPLLQCHKLRLRGDCAVNRLLRLHLCGGKLLRQLARLRRALLLLILQRRLQPCRLRLLRAECLACLLPRSLARRLEAGHPVLRSLRRRLRSHNLALQRSLRLARSLQLLAGVAALLHERLL
eukprot:Rhum_TRINITY_DN15339_c1_g2::Rhum_TRINITY_DN15339_c1_g2_i13::g.150863::m.150863